MIDFPCRVSAEHDDYQSQLGASEDRRERLEREWRSEYARDTRYQILNSIGSALDLYDFQDFICDHQHRCLFEQVALYAVHPTLKPTNYERILDSVRDLLEEFVGLRLETAMEKWLEEEQDFPEFTSDPEPPEPW